MGSDSDLKVMSKAAVMLEKLGIDYEMTIISAHREPDVLFEWTRSRRRTRNESYDRGSWNGSSTFRECVQHCLPIPVIGVPLSGKNLDGMDAVFSIMQMPPGVPVATVAIDGGKECSDSCGKDPCSFR